MIDVEVSAAGVVTVVDVEKNEVQFRAHGWDAVPGGPPLNRRVDAVVAGTTTGFTFPESPVSIESDQRTGWLVFDDHAEPVDLPAGSHLFKVGSNIDIYLAVTDACIVSRGTDRRICLDFEVAAVVTIGFRSQIDAPRETVTVPRTFEGACAAVRHQSAAIETDTPDKSYPTRRHHPPLIDFGPTLEVPDTVSREATGSAITVQVPPSLDRLLVAVPLIYYLQATVEGSKDDAVRVDAPTLSEPVALGDGPTLERDVAGLLQHVFFLDCLVRNAGPYGVDLSELALLDELAIDPDRLYGRSAAERFAEYLHVDAGTVATWRPRWHLSFVVDPTFANLQAVPYLLDRLSLIQLPRPVRVGRQAVITESVRQSYQPRSSQWGDVPRYETVRNDVRLGIREGWLADAIPIDGFRASLTAFENRFQFHRTSEAPRSVVVVINDEAMRDERAGVERIYESRAAELSIEVTVEAALTRAELADVFSSPVDFLHFIGHCEAGGLRCDDGSFSAAELDDTSVQTFFLNACGSYAEGLELVSRGSVAGAATLHNVLNPEATRVGLSFARLVMHGFSVNHALALASRQSLTNKFYAVVGDGTHRLSQGEDSYPADLTATRLSPNEFEIRFNFPQSSIPGGIAKPAFPSDSDYVLRGRPFTAVVGTPALVDYLGEVNVPVVYENEFHWSTELAESLQVGDPPGVTD